MKIYYFLEGSIKIGPLTREQLLSQHLSDETLVYYPDTDSWHPYGEIKGKILADEMEDKTSSEQTVEIESDATHQDEESPKRKKTMRIIRHSLYALGFLLLIGPKLLALYYEKKTEELVKGMMEKEQNVPDDELALEDKRYCKNGLSFTYPANYVIYKDTVINEQWVVRCKNPHKSLEKIQFTIETIDPEMREAISAYSRGEICQNIFDMTSEQLSIEFKTYDVSNRTVDEKADSYSIAVDYVGTVEICGQSSTMQGKLKVLLMDDFVVRCNTYTETEKETTAKVFDSMTFAPHRP